MALPKHKIVDDIEQKQCSVCKEWKSLDYFLKYQHSWDFLTRQCKECLENHDSNERKKNTANWKRWNNKHQEIQLNHIQRWQKQHPDKLRLYNKRLYEKQKHTEKWKLNNKIKVALSLSIRGNKKGRHWETLVGYTLNDLTKRLKRKIPKGYTWNDFVAGRLHLDHKIPISAFNFEKPEDLDFKRCWALKNLQLLPAQENMSKGDKIVGHFQPSLIF